ncbi:metal-sensitive transcriptional regulator [Candidatus Kaiserbacteria bacterium]|nr:metal-sensitive transcriptional regulator [Candidatus Kaiserbacteria bacterium]
MEQTDRKALLNRLNRAEGQVRALREALQADEVTDCAAFMNQIKAARSALKHASEQYVLLHLHQCEALPKAKRDEQVAAAIKILASD